MHDYMDYGHQTPVSHALMDGASQVGVLDSKNRVYQAVDISHNGMNWRCAYNY